jgi:hypothetical protein
LFTTVEVDEDVDIVTGWNFASSTYDKPNHQYCYLRKSQELGSRQVDIAWLGEAGRVIERSSLAGFTSIVREIDYATALTKCRWFSE